MNEMNIPYWRPNKDMSEMNIPYEKPHMEMGEMNIQYGKPNKEMAENEPTPYPKMALAMAYVLDQPWETPYEVTEGIDRGTLFQSLYKPFLGGGKRL